jgi:hypothetical protein
VINLIRTPPRLLDTGATFDATMQDSLKLSAKDMVVVNHKGIPAIAGPRDPSFLGGFR